MPRSSTEPERVDHRPGFRWLVEQDLRPVGIIGVITDGSIGLVPAAKVGCRVAEAPAGQRWFSTRLIGVRFRWPTRSASAWGLAPWKE